MPDEPTRVIGGFPLVEENRGAALFREQVATMKQHILDVVRSEVAEFKTNTGLVPHAIEVEMVDIHTGRVAGDVFVSFEF